MSRLLCSLCLYKCLGGRAETSVSCFGFLFILQRFMCRLLWADLIFNVFIFIPLVSHQNLAGRVGGRKVKSKTEATIVKMAQVSMSKQIATSSRCLAHTSQGSVFSRRAFSGKPVAATGKASCKNAPKQIERYRVQHQASLISRSFDVWTSASMRLWPHINADQFIKTASPSRLLEMLWY